LPKVFDTSHSNSGNELQSVGDHLYISWLIPPIILIENYLIKSLIIIGLHDENGGWRIVEILCLNHGFKSDLPVKTIFRSFQLFVWFPVAFVW
jgi:hypothetical protein